jgi:hypothetical protein
MPLEGHAFTVDGPICHFERNLRSEESLFSWIFTTEDEFWLSLIPLRST